MQFTKFTTLAYESSVQKTPKLIPMGASKESSAGICIQDMLRRRKKDTAFLFVKKNMLCMEQTI